MWAASALGSYPQLRTSVLLISSTPHTAVQVNIRYVSIHPFMYFFSAPERGVLWSAGRDQPAPAQPLPGVQEEDGAGLGGHTHQHLRGPVRRVGLV